MSNALINNIVKARGSWRQARRAGNGRLILNPVTPTESGLGSVVVGAGLALQVSDTLYKLGIKSSLVNIATGLTVLVTLACLALRLVLDDHYVIDSRRRTISSRRTLFWLPIFTKVETRFENIQCVSVNGLMLDDVNWGYGISLFTRGGKRLDLLTAKATCSFEVAHLICDQLALLCASTVYPEPMPERTLSARLNLNKVWEPSGIAYIPARAS